jgi:hypothetical protein
MLHERIDSELKRAEEARAAGNEGQARVCARRAAGLAIRAYYQQQGAANWGGDAWTQLNRLKNDAAVPDAIRAMAVRLTTQVNHNHQLPFEEDVLEDARALVAFSSAKDTEEN